MYIYIYIHMYICMVYILLYIYIYIYAHRNNKYTNNTNIIHLLVVCSPPAGERTAHMIQN